MKYTAKTKKEAIELGRKGVKRHNPGRVGQVKTAHWCPDAWEVTFIRPTGFDRIWVPKNRRGLTFFVKRYGRNWPRSIFG